MKRALVLAALAVGTLSVTPLAHAATWKGVVIGKDAKRRAIVTASANGAVRTTRAPKAFRRARLGDVMIVKGARLPDGTFSAADVMRLARRDHVRFRGIVVRKQGARLFLSAGHSIVDVNLRKGARGGSLKPGDRVSLGASLGSKRLLCDDLKEIGHEGQLDLEGIYLSTDGNVLSLAVVHRGLVKVTIPDGVDVPEMNAGDEISLTVTVEPDGTFTLVSLDDEDSSDDSGDGGNDGTDITENWFTVTGLLASISSDSVSVTVERHPEPVRCAIPHEMELAGFSTGQLVEMTCYFADGRFVLKSLHSKTADVPGDGGAELDISGFIASLDAGKIVVSATGGGMVACSLQPGQDLRGFATGDFVELGCRYSGPLGKYMLTSLSSGSAWLNSEPDDNGVYASFDLQGVVSTLAPGYVAVQVAHHAEPVQCALTTGMDLRGFAVGDAVDLECDNTGAGFVVDSISSDSANWPSDSDQMPDFTVDGILRSIGTDSVGVQVERHPELVRCAFPVGTDLSGFALGDTVEMHCHFHDGKWNLASLDSEHANLTLEN